jgi:hypothetical protein
MNEPTPINPGALAHILDLEALLRQQEQLELPVRHYYVREMTIPAGGILTGKVHLHPHVCTVTAGEIVVASSTGERLKLTAPCTFESPAGVKRAGLAITDTVFTTIHELPAELLGAPLEAIERYLVVDTMEEYAALRAPTAPTLVSP